MRYYILVFVFINACICFGNEQNTDAKTSSPEKEKYFELTRQLQDWEKEKGVESLRKLKLSIMNLDRKKMVDDSISLKDTTNMKLKLLFLFLNTVDKNYDKNFDFDDVPSLNIAPQGAYPSGIAPETIKEPKIRKQYEEDIKKNAIKSENYSFQFKLQRLRTTGLNDITKYVDWNYSKTPEDIKEANRMIDENISDEKTKTELKELLKEQEQKKKQKNN